MTTKTADFVQDISIELLENVPSKLYQINGTNTKDSEAWIQVFDKSTAPVDTDIPVETYLIQPLSNFSIGFIGNEGKPGRAFLNGIGVAYSSAPEQLLNVESGTLFATWWIP
jgi:hypothetical protein